MIWNVWAWVALALYGLSLAIISIEIYVIKEQLGELWQTKSQENKCNPS